MTNYNPASGNSPALSIDQAEQINRLLWRVIDLSKAAQALADQVYSVGGLSESDNLVSGLNGCIQSIELLADQANGLAIGAMA